MSSTSSQSRIFLTADCWWFTHLPEYRTWLGSECARVLDFMTKKEEKTPGSCLPNATTGLQTLHAGLLAAVTTHVAESSDGNEDDDEPSQSVEKQGDKGVPTLAGSTCTRILGRGRGAQRHLPTFYGTVVSLLGCCEPRTVSRNVHLISAGPNCEGTRRLKLLP